MSHIYKERVTHSDPQRRLVPRLEGRYTIPFDLQAGTLNTRTVSVIVLPGSSLWVKANRNPVSWS